MRRLRVDTVSQLVSAEHPAIRLLARRELVGDRSERLEGLWTLPAVLHILARQHVDGRWSYSGGDRAIRSLEDYDQLETYRQLGVLVHKFGLNRTHPSVVAAAAFLGSFQTDAGDYRGIYGNQYSPNYSAAITEVLIHAGFARTPQVERTLRWLISIRQDDGGWAIPTRTVRIPLKAMLTIKQPVEPDRTRPSSHLVTGIVLRAFASDPRSRRLAPARRAAQLLASRLFTRDAYPDRAAASYWLVFSYPFWWTDLLSALDSLSRLGLSAEDQHIAKGLDWFFENQEQGGLWNTGRNRPKDPWSDMWVGLAVCRMLKRTLGPEVIGLAQ